MNRTAALRLSALLAIAPPLARAQSTTQPAVADRPQAEQRLSFQTQGEYVPRVHLNADVAMVYDIDKTLPARLKTWKDAGYTPHVMSGITWGEYAEYYYGAFDGINHMDEVQKESNGKLIGHGKDNYYVCPSVSYGNFIIKGVKRALDAGAEGIFLEEPEYWVRSGWEDGFKARVAGVLQRAVAGARFLAGRAVPHVEAEVFSVPPRARPGVRFHQGVQR